MDMKAYLKDVPMIRNIIGDGFYVYPIKGDGACGLRAVAAWLFSDQSEGPYLGRNVNNKFVTNWEYWKSFFVFPFKRNVGIGKQKTFENESQLFNFFLNSADGAYMWRDNADFAAISNIYQVRIKIITVTHTEDNNPSVINIEPDPDFLAMSEMVPWKISDMILLHTKDTHFDLIVPNKMKILKL